MAGFETLLTAGLTAAAQGAGTAAAVGAPMSILPAAATAGAAGSAASWANALGIVGTGVSAAGTILTGAQSRAASKMEAREMERLAKEERAAASRKANEKRRQMNLLLSRSQAVAADSGSGATDPTVLATEGGIAQEGEYQANVETYLGETRGRGYEGKAAITRQAGNDAFTSGLIGAGGTILSGVSSYYDRYGRKSGGALRYG
jgi:hypothetical protein